MPYLQIGRPVAQSDCWWAADLAARIGPTAAARRIGVTRATLAAVIAGLPVASTTDARLRRARARACARVRRAA
jgi:hypothetical protein